MSLQTQENPSSQKTLQASLLRTFRHNKSKGRWLLSAIFQWTSHSPKQSPLCPWGLVQQEAPHRSHPPILDLYHIHTYLRHTYIIRILIIYSHIIIILSIPYDRIYPLSASKKKLLETFRRGTRGNFIEWLGTSSKLARQGTWGTSVLDAVFSST